MKIKEKRGLSPVIATLLLIALALVLVFLIFIWAKSFIEEELQKFGEPAERSCERIEFAAEVKSDGTVYVSNTGNVPLYGIELKQKDKGSVKSLGKKDFENGLPVGATGKIEISSSESLESGEAIVVPIILGESEEYTKYYICDEKFGEIVDVI